MSDIEIPAPDAPREPLLSTGTVTAVVSGIIALGVAFGLNLSDDQRGAILTIVGVLAPIVVAVIARNKVFSPATVRDIILKKGNE